MWGHSATAPPRWLLRAQDSWDISHIPQHFVVPLWGPTMGVTFLSPSSCALHIPSQRNGARPSLTPRALILGLAWMYWGIEGYWGLAQGLQGSSCLAEPLRVRGFGCHWFWWKSLQQCVKGKRCSVPLWHHQPHQHPASATSTSS